MFRRKHETTLRPESGFIPPSHVRVIPEVYDQEAESNVIPIRGLAPPASEAIHYADVMDITGHIKTRLEDSTEASSTRASYRLRNLAKRAIEAFKPIDEYEQIEKSSTAN